MNSLTLLVTVVSLFYSTTAELYCKDENGNDVDWFIIYKLPKINHRKGSYFADGLKYAYISGPAIKGKSDEKQWKLSEKQVGDQESIFANTLLPVYKHPQKYSSLMYNDDVPGGEGNTYYAHAKGVLAMDHESGFFLTHSIPRFPLAFNNSRYEYPLSASNNGQTGLCVSFKTQEEAKKILAHLLVLRPNVYYWNDGKVLDDNTLFKALVEKKKLKNSAIKTRIVSYKGTPFTAFSKDKKSAVDIYSAYIAPQLQTDFSVETWRRGSGNPLPSNCKLKEKVLNVDSLEMKFKSGKQKTTDQWLYTQDHAKWAVSDSGKSPFVCISDINRMASQFKRGGGSLCIHDPDVWTQFKGLITSIEPCTKNG
ncbi:Deoxyribonuclease-2-like protein [Leptotrombidium deliense]|uniref:Deoxyribonuclease-2-like protein n=1 Tax=Leptotrombidium deliense TaxID=299467 RepID=A0A443RZX4_9ACAR|nr:Deoxyribonuclease-2-like protein [Leptotrombidium deliense]